MLEEPAQDRQRQLTLFAHDALASYAGWRHGQIRWVAESFNTVFRVLRTDAVDGALRVSPHARIHAEGTELVEASWMRAIQASGTAHPPEIFNVAGDSPVLHHGYPGVTGERVCMLFRWVDGEPLTVQMSAARAGEMGRLSASLHHAADGSPVPSPSVPVADHSLYWLIPNRLGEVSAAAPMLTEALERADRLLAELWAHAPSPPLLVHGDLTPANILVEAGTLIPIDFQDLAWALDVQDLAISLSSFDRFDDADDLRACFRRGYASVRQWPEMSEDLLCALTVCRRLNQLNLALELRKPGLEAYIAKAAEFVERWLRT